MTWILTKDALPENQDMEVMIANKQGNVIRGPQYGNHWTDYLFHYNGYRFFHVYDRSESRKVEDVHAWMEIGRPPAQGENND